jgi:hypothetical protein
MTYQLTFACGEPDCPETAVIFCETFVGETTEHLRKRNPVFKEVLCTAKHSGNYQASRALDIVAVPHP